MRTGRRKQRYQSEPLPAKRSNSESPEGQDRSAQGPLRLPLDADAKHIQSGTAMTFPLTPMSSAGEADRAVTGTTTAASITSDRCSPSDRQRGAPEVSGKLDKMDQQPTNLSPPEHPPPSTSSTSSLSTAPPVRAPPSSNGSSTPPATSYTMSHRDENIPIRPRPFHDTQPGHYYSTHPSPPPITTLTHSPSLSSDRSSVSSPAPTILPPLSHPGQVPSHSYLSSGQYRYSAQPNPYHHSHYYPNTVAPPDVFATPTSPYTHGYASGYPPPPSTHLSIHHSSDLSLSPSQQYSTGAYGMYTHGHSGHGLGTGGSGGFTPIYTDDAATKLSDRVRRRCFNCCSTDTSTWRRSSLNPGKVLCNKCGLFERTHSRPRPDQFPHKRGPLPAPSLPPPPRNSTNDANGGIGQSPPSHNLPPTTAHPSLAASYSHPSALPQIQEWLRNPNTTNGSSASSNTSAAPSRGTSSSSTADRYQTSSSSSIPTGSGLSLGGASQQSPQVPHARHLMRTGSTHPDVLRTPPQPAQNLTPSPSPPPEPSRGVGSSPRINHGSGSDAGKA